MYIDAEIVFNIQNLALFVCGVCFLPTFPILKKQK
jgi:hypothetical protein